MFWTKYMLILQQEKFSRKLIQESSFRLMSSLNLIIRVIKTIIMDDIRTLKLINKELKRKSGNKLKGNPNPKIHPNYNIKYALKPGPTSHWGKLKSSRNAQKYKGKALRLSKDSL